MQRRLIAFVCLMALPPVMRAAEPGQTVSDDDLRIEGVFDSALPRTEPARSARLIVHPHLGDLRRSDFLRTALGLRYGLTERWEAVTEVDWFFSHGLKSSPLLEKKGLSSLHIGTKYRVGRLAAGPWESSVGADLKRPVDNPPRSVTDGLRHFSPYATFSRDLPERPDWRVFWGAGYDLTAPTGIPGERRKNEFTGDSANLSAGFIHARGPVTYTIETGYSWMTNDGGDGGVVMLRPGLVWTIPPRFTFGSKGRWLLGTAVQFTHGPDGSDFRVSAKVRGNFDFLRLIGGRKSSAGDAPSK
jgi:hypothetical protein